VGIAGNEQFIGYMGYTGVDLELHAKKYGATRFVGYDRGDFSPKTAK
jgi:hypothetical protein